MERCVRYYLLDLAESKQKLVHDDNDNYTSMWKPYYFILDQIKWYHHSKKHLNNWSEYYYTDN